MNRIVVLARSLVLSLALALAAAVPSQAADLRAYLRPDHPESYRVVEGDTLWDISGRFLTQPWVWPELWRANPQIADPHLIFPGDLIRLVYVDGQPRLTLERGQGGRTYRLSSGTEKLEPRIRAEPILSSIPVIRMEAISGFLVSNRIVEPGVLEAAPHILGGGEGRLIIGAGDRFYVRGEVAETAGNLSVVRRGPTYVDPETREVLGVEATDLGVARILTSAGEVTSMETINSRSEIRVGNLLLPTEERSFDSSFFPKAPNVSVDGSIISVFDGVTQIGQFDVVVINKGERDGLQVGDVLTVLRRGPEVADRVGGGRVRLPSEPAGLMMTFRVFEKLAYGVILENTRALAVFDEVRSP